MLTLWQTFLYPTLKNFKAKILFSYLFIAFDITQLKNSITLTADRTIIKEFNLFFFDKVLFIFIKPNSIKF